MKSLLLLTASGPLHRVDPLVIVRTPDGAQRNPGLPRGTRVPDTLALHPGYVRLLGRGRLAGRNASGHAPVGR